MLCPFCRHDETRVLDSRETEEGLATRRRRECAMCRRRFTTYERVDGGLITVRKKDGSKQPFESSKLRAGISTACEKRPVSRDRIDDIVLQVENTLRDASPAEVTSEDVGRLVMEVLRETDHIAYVRFASVYEEFAEPASFVNAVQGLSDEDDSSDDLAHSDT